MCVVRRVWMILLLVLTVGVAAALVYVLRQHSTVAQAGQTPGYSPAASTPTHSSAVPSTDVASSLVPTVFLGDDYTAGAGATQGGGWTAPVATALDLDPAVVAEPGAGYARSGLHGDNYGALLPRVVAAQPALIVVSGGRNDTGDDPGTLRSDTAALFAQLHRRLPEAEIVAIAPWWGDSPHPAKLHKVDAAVRTGVEGAGGTYLDPPDPLRGHPSWMADAANPNDRGYAAIARSVTAALRPLVPR
jgi:lysophospholipase L1-like esterase